MKVLASAICVFPMALSAQETAPAASDPSQPANLEVVFSGAEYTLSVIVPAVEIVGFAHPASNAAEQAKVAVAISELSQPLSLFVVAPEAGCGVVSANVALIEAGGKPSESEGVTREDQGNEAEFQAEYSIRCTDIDALEEMRFDYFNRFELAGRLTVHMQTETESHVFDVTRETPLVDLSEIL